MCQRTYGSRSGKSVGGGNCDHLASRTTGCGLSRFWIAQEIGLIAIAVTVDHRPRRVSRVFSCISGPDQRLKNRRGAVGQDFTIPAGPEGARFPITPQGN